MNDQHPCLRVGDRVTLTDTRISDEPVPLVITNLHWDAHGGEWFATAMTPDLTSSVFRRARCFIRGWP